MDPEGIHKAQEVKRKSILGSIPLLHAKDLVDIFSYGIFLVVDVVRIFSAFFVGNFDEDNPRNMGPLGSRRPDGIEEWMC